MFLVLSSFVIIINNGKPRKETGAERDEDAAMDVWSHEEREDR